MASLDDDMSKLRATVQIVEVLMTDKDGHYDEPMAMEELCGLFCQYCDEDLRALIESMISDPGVPVKTAEESEQAILLKSQSEAEAFFSTKRNELPFY